MKRDFPVFCFRSAEQLPRREKGFSLIEVLVTVAIITVSLVVLFGAMRQQIFVVQKLRPHSEARILLNQAVNQFQYGDSIETVGQVRGQYGEYNISFQDLPVERRPLRFLTTIQDEFPTAPEVDYETGDINEQALECKQINIKWQVGSEEQALSVDAWRYQPLEMMLSEQN